MIKKIISIILCLLCLAMSLTACDDGDLDTYEESSEVETTSTIESSEVSTMDTEAETEKKQKPKKEYVNMWKTTTENGIMIRDITINTGKGGADIEIVQLTDMHLSWINEQDLADEQLKATYETRSWGRNGSLWGNAERCLEYFKDSDRVVITGDIYDYLSSETIKQVNDRIFNKYDNVIAVLGNHESVKEMGEERKWNADIIAERMQTLSGVWANDPYYSSDVLGNKVMLIQLDNGTTGHFWESQIPKLTSDLATARANGYAVLIFYHAPIATYNIDEYNVKSLNHKSSTREFYNFAECYINKWGSGVDAQICSLIVNNGDIIKGAFSGHLHSDFYTEIIASSPSGEATRIPQYVLMGTPYDNGHALRITVK